MAKSGDKNKAQQGLVPTSQNTKVELPPELKAIIDQIPKEKREQALQSILSFKLTISSGPLPSPEILAQYNEIIPNGADRITTMAEKQSDHRMKLESIAIPAQLAESSLGQKIAAVISVLALACATYCAAIHETTVATTIGGATIVSLVYVFITGKKKGSQSLQEKNPNNKGGR